MPTELEIFGRVLRGMRKSKGLTQERLAEASGLHPMYISAIERGIKNPSLESLIKLSGALKLTPGYLLALAFPPSGKEKISGEKIELYIHEITIELTRFQSKIQRDIDNLLKMIHSLEETHFALKAIQERRKTE